MITGSYTVHCYCDGDDCKGAMFEKDAAEFIGRNQQVAIEVATASGWSVVVDGGLALAYCPACTDKRRGPSPPAGTPGVRVPGRLRP